MKRHDTRRRFEQWARNPECEANTVSAVHGIGMDKVVIAEGGTPTMGQSPFALGRGQTFEKRLFEDEGTLLGEALQKAGVLKSPKFDFYDFRLRLNGGRQSNLGAALTATADYLRHLAEVTPTRPALVAGATVVVPGGVMLPEALLVIDALVVTAQETNVNLAVGEIKTYPDRGGHTDSAELATARAQAGVYVHGTRLVLAHLKLADRLHVSDRGFLVLSKPGWNSPSVRGGEDFRYQTKRAERGFARLRQVAELISAAADDEAKIGAVRASGTTYRESCISFCDRAQHCHQLSISAGHPSALGEDMARLLGPVSLTRAVEILSGAEPATNDESLLLEHLIGEAG